MKKDFDFNDIGKRTPYRTPEGFFENVQAKILKRADEEKKRRRLLNIRIGVSVALAVAAMMCGVVFFSNVPKELPERGMDTGWVALGDMGTDAMDMYVRSLTDEELAEWVEFSENDIYYELLTENLNEDEN